MATPKLKTNKLVLPNSKRMWRSEWNNNQTALCICNGFSLISENSSTKSHFTLKNPHMFFSGLETVSGYFLQTSGSWANYPQTPVNSSQLSGSLSHCHKRKTDCCKCRHPPKGTKQQTKTVFHQTGWSLQMSPVIQQKIDNSKALGGRKVEFR